MQFHEKKIREIAFLAVLNFFPVQKLIFGHFCNCKKWIFFVKFINILFHEFFCLDFFYIFWPAVVCTYVLQFWHFPELQNFVLTFFRFSLLTIPSGLFFARASTDISTFFFENGNSMQQTLDSSSSLFWKSTIFYQNRIIHGHWVWIRVPTF